MKDDYLRRAKLENLCDGLVNTEKEHIKIFYGDDMLPACLIQPRGEDFVIQFLLEHNYKNETIIKNVRQDIELQLVRKRLPNPWAYAIYYCTTISNIFSQVHWIIKRPGIN